MNVRRLRPSTTRRSAALWARAGLAGAGVAAIAAGAVIGAGGHAPVASGSNHAKPATPAMRLAAATQNAYWMVASDGGIFPFGGAASLGSEGGTHLNMPIVGMAATPDGQGYWLVASDGGIFTHGDAVGYGSTGNIRLNQPIVGMARTPSGHGYWLVASDGGIFPFGDAAQGLGSTGNIHLNKPIVGMASTADGRGYWLVASDGGMFPFGDAGGYGSTGNIVLNKPIVGMAPTPDGKGYWLVASDGGMFPYGDAGGFGSTGAMHLNSPIVGMAATQTGRGYWLVAGDGGIFPFGDAVGSGSTGGTHLNAPIVAMAASPTLFPSAISITTPTSLPADGTSTESLTATVIDASGLRVPGVNVVFSSTTAGCGSFNPTTGVTDLSGHVSSTYTASHTIASCGITVRQAYGAVSVSSTVVQHGGAPASITASPATSTWTADQGSTGVPTAFTVRDSLGNGLAGVQVDLSDTLANATGYPTSAVTGSNGSVTVPLVDTTAGDSGIVTGTVHGTSISQATGTISIIAGNVHTITLTGPATTQTAGSSYSALVQVADAYNNPINPATNQVTFGGTALATAPDNTHSGSGSFASAFSSGQDTATILSYVEGTNLTLTATYGGVTGTANVNVNPAATHAVTATPSTAASDTADQGNAGIPLTFKVTDLYGNAISGVALNLTTGLAHATFAPASPLTTGDGTNGTTLGAATTSLTDTHAGDTGTVTATVAGSSPAITGSTGTITISSGALASLHLGSIGTQTAGTQYAVTVTAADQFGNAVNPATANVVPSGTALAASPGGQSASASFAGAFSGGSATLNVTSVDAGTVALTLTDSVDGASPVSVTSTPSYKVNPAGAHTVAATPSAAASDTADQGNAGIPLTFTVTDLYGNAISGVSLTLTTGLGHATFTPASPLTTGDGTSGTTLGVATTTLKDTHAGDAGTVTATVTGSSPAVAGSTGTITITSGALSTLKFSTITTQVAGTQYTPTLTASDAYSNPVNPATSAITFSGTALDTAPDGTHTGTAVLAGAFSGGQATVNVTSYKAESATLAANDGTITTGPSSFTVGSAVPSSFTVSPNTPQNVSADSGSEPVSFAGVDPYGNLGAGINYDLSETGLSHAALPSNPVVANSLGVISFTMTDTNSADSGTVTATVVNSTSHATTATITITPGLLSSFTWSSSAASVTAIGTQTAGTPFTAYLNAADAHGNPVNPSTGNVTLSGHVKDQAPDGVHTGTAVFGGAFSNGQAAVNVTAYNAEASSLTATDTTNTAGGTPVTNTASFTVSPNTYKQLVATSSSFTTVDIGGSTPNGIFFQYPTSSLTASVTLTAEDTYANTEKTNTDAVTVTLADDPGGNAVDGGTLSSGATFTAMDTALVPATLAVPLSQGQGSFTYTAPSTFSGTTTSTNGQITFNDPAGSGITNTPATTEVTLTKVHTVTVGVSSTNLTADAAASPGLTVSGTAIDGSSNQLSNVRVLFSSTGLQGTNLSGHADTPTPAGPATFIMNPTKVTGTATTGNAFATLYGAPTNNVNLSAESQQVTVTPGAFANLNIGTLASTQTAGTPYSATVNASDAEGNAVNPSGTATASGTALDTAPDTTDKGTASLTAFSGGVATLNGTAFKAETGATLSLTLNSVTSNTKTFEVTNAAAHSVTAAALAQSNCCTADQGNTGIGVSYTVEDLYQNLVPSQSLTLTSDLAHATVDTAASPSKANSVVFPVNIQTNASGVASATVYDTVSGDTGKVTASVSPTVQGSTTTITMTPGSVANLTVSQPTNQVAGALYKVTVTASDHFGNAANPTLSTLACNSTSSSLTCTGKALDTAPDGVTAGSAAFESQFSGGQAILDVHSYKAETGVALSVADGSVTAPAMTTYTVTPAAATQFLVNSNSTHYNASTHTLTVASPGGETDTFSMTMADQYQNVANTHLSDVIHVSLVGTDGGTLTGGGQTTGPDGASTTVSVNVTLSGGSQTFTYTAANPDVPLQTGTISFSDTTSNAMTPNPSTITVKT